MPSEVDQTDLKILYMLEDDARLPVGVLALRVGVSEAECAQRIARLQGSGHIGGYTIWRNYPTAALRPVGALIKIVQDPGRTGNDLQRSMDFIPEIIAADLLDSDHTVLMRVEVSDLARLDEITGLLGRHSAVLSLEVTTTTPLLLRRQARHKIDRMTSVVHPKGSVSNEATA